MNMKDKQYRREIWTSKNEFLLSMLGYCVGLGNIWRFPYLTYDTGGGAFLVPYLIMLLFVGVPLMLMEMSLGQYCSQGMITVWNAVPCMRGIGFGIMIAVTLSKMSSMLITAYSYYYLFASFQRTLPWSGCHNHWNTVYCSELLKECLDVTGIIFSNGSCVQINSMTSSELVEYGIYELPSGSYDTSNYTDPFAGLRSRPSEEYWRIRVRRESESMKETGTINWDVALCLLLSWVTVFICLINGIKSSGKVVYVTAIAPYILLTILLVLGLTLPGHADGIRFFIFPRWEKIKSAQAWLSAAAQICYSLGSAYGGVITLSSYNRFRNNVYVDAICLSIANSATSIFAGFTIFSIVGFMAFELDRDISTVVTQGYGLAFIVYPEALNLLPVSPLWSTLFFLMLIAVALDSHFASTEAIITAIVDFLPYKCKVYKRQFLIAYCVIGFLMGLICTTEAGPYWASLIDQSSIGFGILCFAFLECVSIAWVYGSKRFRNDIRSMLGDKWIDHTSFWWWILNWRILTPTVLLIVIIFNIANWNYPTYNGPYPSWAIAISWTVTGSTLVPIPLVFIYQAFTSSGTLRQRTRMLFSPQDNWGPILPKNREHAWECHLQHGTTMGGKRHLLPAPTEDSYEIHYKPESPLFLPKGNN